METIYRLFMYIFPFAVCLALYVWMFRKALKVPHKVLRMVSLAIVVGGIGYTLYRIAVTVGNVFTNDNFHFQILIVTIIVLFLASVAMAFGEPEEKGPQS